jgi:hypothetical protein
MRVCERCFVAPAIRLALALCVSVVVPGRGHAQGTTASVVPGITVHPGRPHGADTVVYQRSVTRAGSDSTAGTRTVVSRVVKGSDRQELLEVEQRFPAGGGEIVDTAVADLRTLRAVAHRSHQPTKTMRFDFDGSIAEGTVVDIASKGDSGAREQAVHQPLGGPIFDSNIIDLVVASLPLDRGFTAELPFFIYERGGRVPMAVAVRERSSVDLSRLGHRDAWIVTVGVPGAPATIWVDAKTHVVLRVRYDIAARGVSFTDERITPLPG